jgi:cytochrome c biogenesis protein CcmG, thiol:disulfide interchange protein DsbE
MEVMEKSTRVDSTRAAGQTWNLPTVAMWSGVVLILAVLGWGLVQTNASRPDDVAPDFELTLYDGFEWNGRSTVTLSELEGQVVVVNFWASWCVECRLEADLLEQTWRQYRDQGVVFLGVAYVDAQPNAVRYLEEFGITYPNGPDLRTAISRKYQITGVPETFFIGKDGKVAPGGIIIGPVNRATLTAQIERLLAE